MRQQILVLAAVLSLLFAACNPTQKTPEILPAAVSGIAFPDTRFLVASDLHYYDTSLGTSGPAFQHYLDQDRKLLTLSGEILDTAIQAMAGETADFILIPGDLTKDGEEICHRGVAEKLRPLLSDKRVLVVPGNHDILNPESVRFTDKGTEPVPNITPDQFKEIYHDFGYGDALFQDPNSLSYVAEPVPGLWVLALDSNRYRENKAHPLVGGAFSKETLAWMQETLEQAKVGKKAVMALLHHGIMEHYPANEQYYPRYLVDDHEKISGLLAANGVRLAFTGHFHAQDITARDMALENATAFRIFDIETGSLVTAPCPYRQVEISGNKASITSRFITAIPSMGEGFKTYAQDYVFNGTVKLANAKLEKFRVSKPEQDKINRQISQAYVTHLKGDEVRPEKAVDTEGFGLWLKLVAWYQKDLLEGWVTDLAPADNRLTIDLSTGKTD